VWGLVTEEETFFDTPLAQACILAHAKELLFSISWYSTQSIYMLLLSSPTPHPSFHSISTYSGMEINTCCPSDGTWCDYKSPANSIFLLFLPFHSANELFISCYL